MKTEILGISQTYQWYLGESFDFPITDFTFKKEKDILSTYREIKNCQARFGFGGDLTKWKDFNYEGYESLIKHNILFEKNEIERLIFTVSGETRNLDNWVIDIKSVTEIILSKYPYLNNLYLQPVIGGDDNNSEIRAVKNQPTIVEAIEIVISESNNSILKSGFDCKIQTHFFSDNLGHLTFEGALHVQNILYNFYNFNAPNI